MKMSILDCCLALEFKLLLLTSEKLVVLNCTMIESLYPYLDVAEYSPHCI